MKFQILLNMPKFPIAKQARIIVACMAIHNFIRESRLADRDFDLCDNMKTTLHWTPEMIMSHIAMKKMNTYRKIAI